MGRLPQAHQVVRHEAVEQPAERMLRSSSSGVFRQNRVWVVTVPAGKTAAISVRRLVAAATSR